MKKNEAQPVAETITTTATVKAGTWRLTTGPTGGRAMQEMRILRACARLLEHHSANDRVLRALDALKIDVREAGLTVDTFSLVFDLLGYRDALGREKFEYIEEALYLELSGWTEGRETPLTPDQAELLTEWLVDTRESLMVTGDFLSVDPFPPPRPPVPPKARELGRKKKAARRGR